VTGPDRRGFVAVAVAAWLAPRRAFGNEAGDAVVTYWGEPIAINDIARGDWKVAIVDGERFFLRRRTVAQIAVVRAAPLAKLPDPIPDEERAPGDGEWLVVSGTCTHAGCDVEAGLGPYNGWQCFCHGSTYDLSGRVRLGPARRNLPVIPHAIYGSTMVLRR
jgi:ubiquinol-cytochrome c reductase iron-sulfur subunit